MAVPKAPVNNNRFLPLGEYEIGTPRQIFTMNSISISYGVYSFPKFDFWSRVSLSDLGHDVTSLTRKNVIGQCNASYTIIRMEQSLVVIIGSKM